MQHLKGVIMSWLDRMQKKRKEKLDKSSRKKQEDLQRQQSSSGDTVSETQRLLDEYRLAVQRHKEFEEQTRLAGQQWVQQYAGQLEGTYRDSVVYGSGLINLAAIQHHIDEVSQQTQSNQQAMGEQRIFINTTGASSGQVLTNQDGTATRTNAPSGWGTYTMPTPTNNWTYSLSGMLKEEYEPKKKATMRAKNLPDWF
jgi:hypothetical protein